MLGRALDLTFRNLTTLVCITAFIYLPIHLIHAAAFRNELAVAELRADIATLTDDRKVRGVGPEELDRERVTLWAVLAIDLGALPFMLGAARRVFDRDEEGEVPTIGDALANSLRSLSGMRLDAPISLASIAIGAVAGWLLLRIGMILTELLGNDATFVGVGTTRGIAVAVGVAISVGGIAAAASRRRVEPKLELY